MLHTVDIVCIQGQGNGPQYDTPDVIGKASCLRCLSSALMDARRSSNAVLGIVLME
jgi:hypothetical protein